MREISDRYGLAVDPDAKVEDITVGAQQRVEILRALYRGAEVLVLDEPTAVLTAQESEELFEVMRELKAAASAIVFISHKLNEVLDVADRISVLQRGKKVATLDAAGATESELARLMVGREVLFRLEKERTRPGEPMLEVADLEVGRRPRAARAAGRVADGPRRRGRRHRGRGRQRPGGADRVRHGPAHARRRLHPGGGQGDRRPRRRRALDAGVGHIPEDRHRRGLVLDFDLAENLAMREYRRPPMARRGMLSPEAHEGQRRAAAEGLRRPRRRRRTRRRRRCRAATSRRS